jgi:hypothetical protein
MGLRATASASVREGKKSGVDLWRLHVGLRMPESAEVTLVPTFVITTSSPTVHEISNQLQNGNWRTRCSRTIPASEAHVLCKTEPTGKLVDAATHKVKEIHNYPRCERCKTAADTAPEA